MGRSWGMHDQPHVTVVHVVGPHPVAALAKDELAARDVEAQPQVERVTHGAELQPVILLDPPARDVLERAVAHVVCDVEHPRAKLVIVAQRVLLLVGRDRLPGPHRSARNSQAEVVVLALAGPPGPGPRPFGDCVCVMTPTGFA